jgi:DNA polymerase-3 subunit alpha
MPDSPGFIHLRVHTEHSLLEGAVPVKMLPKLAAEAGMPAVAITDSDNLFAALEFATHAAAAGVQPLIGCVLSLGYDVPAQGEQPKPPAGIVLLAQDAEGYGNLLKLNSCLYLRPGSDLPRVTPEDLEAHVGGLICLTGGPDGPVGRLLRAGQRARAEALVTRLRGAFGDRLYVEVQRHPVEGGLPEAERLSERGHVEIAYAMDLPLVATNDVYFPESRMFEAHDALICIADGAYVDQQGSRRRLTPQHYFKTPAEMAALFADLPEALENSVEIARRCAFAPSKRKPILPRFADDEVEELRRQARAGLDARLAVISPAAPLDSYRERLEFELGVIEQMGFPGYFLIVADFIQWAKQHAIPVGPGRGSGAGSLVAYALTITDLDPLRYGLLFERFLNPERVSMPDFDIDFCMDRREEVIGYVQQKYGRDRVAQIITFGALLSKAAVRDVGRVLQMPYGQVDRISKLIPVEGVKPVSIEKALEMEERLRTEKRAEEVVARLLDYAQKIEGLYRNASTHAAGVVIGDRPLDELVPLYRDPRSEMPATQFNMKWVEAAGLVKFDFLGLKTLTVIQNALELIRGSGRDLNVAADGTVLYEPPAGAANDIGAIPLDDQKSYRLYSEARTVAVFQVESSGMMDALHRMRPTCIEDIVALVALYRPGPMANIPTYCEVKNGLKPVESIHPSIDHILAETQGIIVYQEQVMQIAQVMAGYSLGGADLLRRAMGKKIAAEMARERPKFIEGAVANGVDKKKAGEIFDLLEKFADYGFNKSHAAAYAVVSYQTAWLKANHPVEFMAGVMNCDLHLTDKLAIYAEEVRRGLGIGIVAPCVNRSGATFTVRDGRIHYALGALKNVGVEAMRAIVEARGDRPFVTLFDLARRVDLKRLGKRPLEMLARAGAFDALDRNRRRVLEGLDPLVAWSGAVHEARASAQVSLFGEAGEDLPEPRLPQVEDWSAADRLAEEHKAVGFYLTGHPLDDYRRLLEKQGCLTLAGLQERAERAGGAVGRVGVLVGGLQERKSGKGTRFFRLSISDPTGQVAGIALFTDDFDACRQVFDKTNQVILTLEARFAEGGFDPVARAVAPIDPGAADAFGMGLRVFIDDPAAVVPVRSLLDRMAKAGRATGPLSFCVVDPETGREIEVTTRETYALTPPIKSAIKSLPGVALVEEV